jgi:CRISPR-associated protein Cmr5
MKTLEQKYAEQIYEQVEQFGEQNPAGTKKRKQYGSMSHKLPVLVRTAGLTQALAFVDSRGKDAHKALLAHLADIVVGGDTETFLARSREDELQEYMYLMRKTMVALTWYKRFAQSVLKVEPTDEDEEDGS